MKRAKHFNDVFQFLTGEKNTCDNNYLFNKPTKKKDTLKITVWLSLKNDFRSVETRTPI